MLKTKISRKFNEINSDERGSDWCFCYHIWRGNWTWLQVVSKETTLISSVVHGKVWSTIYDMPCILWRNTSGKRAACMQAIVGGLCNNFWETLRLLAVPLQCLSFHFCIHYCTLRAYNHCGINVSSSTYITQLIWCSASGNLSAMSTDSKLARCTYYKTSRHQRRNTKLCDEISCLT